MAVDIGCRPIDGAAYTAIIRAHTRALLKPHLAPLYVYKPYATLKASAIVAYTGVGLGESFFIVQPTLVLL
jgi:hypothetical protein